MVENYYVSKVRSPPPPSVWKTGVHLGVHNPRTVEPSFAKATEGRPSVARLASGGGNQKKLDSPPFPKVLKIPCAKARPDSLSSVASAEEDPGSGTKISGRRVERI